jgi:hypothetical protein
MLLLMQRARRLRLACRPRPGQHYGQSSKCSQAASFKARMSAPGDLSRRAHAFSIPADICAAAVLLIASAASAFALVQRASDAVRDESFTRCTVLLIAPPRPLLRACRLSTRISKTSSETCGCCIRSMRSVMNICMAPCWWQAFRGNLHALR